MTSGYVLGKILPQSCIHGRNWLACQISPSPTARSSSTLSSLPGAVARRSFVQYGRLSSSRLNLPFIDHNLQDSLTENFNKTVCHSALDLREGTQVPAASTIKNEASSLESLQNEEAEGELKAPMMRLRSLLHLQDIYTETNLHELLVVADYLERLGLDIYFREEIKCILDHAFRIWTEINSGTIALAHYGLGELKSCALAFYLLRSHEYEVSPRVFRFYQKDDGTFGSRGGQATARDADVIDLVNLHRASNLRFRADAVLDEAFIFTSAALQSLLEGAKDSNGLLSEKAAAEVSYRLTYPWCINFRMAETRHTVLNFQPETVAEFSRFSSTVTSLMLALATQIVNEFLPILRDEVRSLQKYGGNILPSPLHAISTRTHLDDILRWTEESGLAKYNIRTPRMLLPFEVGYAYNLPPLSKYKYTRVLNAKIYYILIILDDLFEVGADVEHLEIFLDALKRWDPSLLEKIPADQGPIPIRVFFQEIYNITNVATQQFCQWHGNGLIPPFSDHWMPAPRCYFKERKWLEASYTPPVEEYVNVHARTSLATETGCPLLYYALPWESVNREFLQSRPDIRVMHPVNAAARFFNDVQTYQWERAHPKEDKLQPSLIDSLMKENPNMTEKDAVQEVQRLGLLAAQEATEELLSSKIPYRGVKDILLANGRVTMFLYYFTDGLRNSGHLLSHVMDDLPHLAYEVSDLEPSVSPNYSN